MLDTLVGVANDVGNLLLLLTTSAIVSLTVLVGLQQIGKRHRTSSDKVSHSASKLKRSVLKKTADVAVKNENDAIFEGAVREMSFSYLNSFYKDVSRGIRVLTKNDVGDKKPLTRRFGLRGK